MTDRLRFLVGLVLVAAGAAAFAIAFRSSLAWLYRALFAADDVVDAVRGLPPWMRFALPVCGATAAGVIAFFRSVPAQGVSNVMEAVALGNVRLSLRATVSRVLASWAAIAAGMSIGREGPLIEFGGSLGATFSRVLGVSLDRTRVLVAAGTAAGFAAAYNTPFAAVLFVLETIIGIAALEALLPAMAATVIATALTRAVVGGGPIYGQRAFVLQSAADLVWFGALGLAAAVAAACFKGLLSQFEQALLRHPLPQPWRAALGGVLVGAIAIWIPEVAGNGYEPLNALLNQQLAVGVLIVLIIAKVIATSASVASGVPGGIFTAVLLVGGALGTLWAHALVWFGLATAADTGSYALVGMAATTAASIHAPLTAAVLVFELSGDYPIVLPLLIATVVSTSVSRALGTESVYEAELRRKGLGWELTLEGRQLTK
ncbi:MAG TPA: chloride channel protein [Vicinamibacterales bacterium]|nr:chloride channel protein [Vicinamibacterales bacterium]